MLNVALAYKAAVKEITSDETYGISKYSLTWLEWQILKKLCDVLKACWSVTVTCVTLTHLSSLLSGL